MLAKLFLLISPALFVGASYAASKMATLTGTVVDTSGAVVAGASVNLHQVAGFGIATATSDSSGRFVFIQLTAGEYVIDASARGLTIAQPESVTLVAGADRDLTIQLVVSAVNTQVSVTAAGQPQSVDQASKALDVVNVEDAERRGIFSVSDAVRFLPGLRVSTRGSPGEFTTVQTRGLRVTDTGVLIDGFPFRDVTSIQDEASAFIGDLLLVDSSRIEVLRGSGSSLYGSNSMSGTINIITDPGGEQTHGDIDLQGGGLGLFHGVASLAGGALSKRLGYSAGISNLNVTEGVDGVEAARDWSGQGAITYTLTPKMRVTADTFANTGYLQIPVTPAATPGVTTTGIIPAIPLPFSQMQSLDKNFPYDPGNSTFLPSLGDPDAAVYSHFVFALFRFEQQVNSRFSYRAGYEVLDTHRNNTNGPAGPNTPDNFEPTFNTKELYNGSLNTVRAEIDYFAGAHQLLTAGYEFQREHYLNVNSDQNPDLMQRLYNSTEATQRTNAAFAQDQIRILSNRLQVLLSGRFTHISVDRPTFVGSTSPYANLPLPPPPSAYTGDASIAYFIPRISTKIRGHIGNSFRQPSIFERFGGYFYGGEYIPNGNPELAPERAISLDFGFDQYLFHDHLRLSGTYFYSHLQNIIDYLNFPPGYVDPYGRTSGYYNTQGGIARGVEFSADFHPWRSTSIFGSYTYTNAIDRTSQYYTGTAVDPLQTPRILPNMVTFIVTQSLGKHVDVAADFYGGSSYLYPLYGLDPSSGFAYPYAYRFGGPHQLGVSAAYSLPVHERMYTRFYVRVSNALDQDFYEDGFRTPHVWAVGGIHFSF